MKNRAGREFLLLAVVVVVVMVLVKTFFLQAFFIPSKSMEPGLVRHDRILVEKPSYWGSGTPQRGDVIVFADPGGWLDPEPLGLIPTLLSKVGLYPAGGHLVKRVIGVVGDTIHCCDEQRRITVNGHALDETSYARIEDGSCYGPMIGDCSTDSWTVGPVPAGKVFVMGDNRNHSADSTVHLDDPGGGFVSTDLVVGRVVALVWPIGRFTILHRPGDFDEVPDP